MKYVGESTPAWSIPSSLKHDPKTLIPQDVPAPCTYDPLRYNEYLTKKKKGGLLRFGGRHGVKQVSQISQKRYEELCTSRLSVERRSKTLEDTKEGKPRNLTLTEKKVKFDRFRTHKSANTKVGPGRYHPGDFEEYGVREVPSGYMG